MTIREMLEQGFYYARTCRSLWLFGFVVGVASGGSNGGAGGGGGHDAGGGVVGLGSLLAFSGTELGAIVIVIILAIVAVTLLRFVAEGALIEGVVRARRGGKLTIGEGFRAGWAHWFALVQIALIFFAVTIGSVALLVAPCVIAMRTLGPLGAVLTGIPALVIAVPWLVTLYLVQAFAWRIAVLENRRALDAIDKARLFLHGRLVHGLKLIVATFLGTVAFVVATILTVVPVVVAVVALIQVLPVFPVIIIGCLVVVPLLGVLAAMAGTFRSSVWTIGYVTQVES